MSLWLGSKNVVVISGKEELKELMHNPVFDDRRPSGRVTLATGIYTGTEENKGRDNQSKIMNMFKEVCNRQSQGQVFLNCAS